MTPRPDELANEAQIERDKNLRSKIKSGAKFIGATALLPQASKIMPLLNEIVPTNFAMKGLEKISPSIHKFLKKGESMGLNIRDGMDFISGKISNENKSIIENYSPDLFNFIKEHISNGRNPLEAGALAQMTDKFKKVIKKMEEENKTPWSAILQNEFGSEQQTQQNQTQTSQGQPQKGTSGEDRLLNAIQLLRQSRGG